MPPIVIDLVISALILGMTYALMSEGLWGSALMFFNVLFAGMIAFNFYEKLARLLDGTGIGWGFSDTLCLMALFLVSLTALRLTTETLGPAMVRFPGPVFHLGRILFGAAGSITLVAILLLAFEVAPVHKKVFGVIDWDYKPPFKLGIDRGWLGFFQHSTGEIFANYSSKTRDPYGQYQNARVFDPRSEWLLIHQDARPYGTETVLEDTPEEPAGAPGAPGAPGGPGGGAAGGGRPGDPTVVGPAVGGGVVIPGN